MNPATAATTAVTAAAGARRPSACASKISQGWGPRCMATLGNMNSKSTQGAPRLAKGQSMKITREGVSRMLPARVGMQQRRARRGIHRSRFEGHQLAETPRSPGIEPSEVVLAGHDARREPSPARKDVRHQLTDGLHGDGGRRQAGAQLLDRAEDPIKLGLLRASRREHA